MLKLVLYVFGKLPCLAFWLTVTLASTAEAQNPAAAPSPTKVEEQDTIRIRTALVQTDVNVFDQTGKLIEGLPREAFELKVDGKPMPVSLFQRVTAGSLEEAANLSAARRAKTPDNNSVSNPLERGQSVIFFVDDFHLEAEHVERAQEIIHHYLDHVMRAGDRAMIVSGTGQLGFLEQQFSDSRSMLHAAAKRLKYQSVSKPDFQRPTMGVYEAIQIERNRADVLEYMIQQYRTQSEFFKAPRAVVVQTIRLRASQILSFHRQITNNLFLTIHGMMQRVMEIPGRKLLFFVSSGFIIDPGLDRSLSGRLTNLVDWAGHAGVVCYTVDARGLNVPLPDISEIVTPSLANEPGNGATPMDATTMVHSEQTQTQQALRTLAYDTGGRPLLNNNALEQLVAEVALEYQSYYVLAWEPEVFERDKPKFRKIEVTIKDRPELKVSVRRGFISTMVPEPPAKATKPEATAKALAAALREVYPRNDFPLSLYSSFQHEAEGGYQVVATVAIPIEVVAAVNEKVELEVLCAVVDAQGKVVKHDGKQLSFTRPASGLPQFVAHFRLPITPGHFQIRAGVRNPRNGQIGTHYQWLEVPAFTTGKLALSTMRLYESQANSQSDTAPELNYARRFSRSSKLLLQLDLYNAALNATTRRPEVTMEIQILRGTKSVLDAPAHEVSLQDVSDFARVPYSAEIPLRGLARGLYTLQLRVADRVRKKQETQNLSFFVE